MDEAWDRGEISAAAAYLSDQLRGDEARQRDVQQIVAHYVGREDPTTETATELMGALELYLGEDFARYLVAYLASADQEPALLKDYDDGLDPETAIYLRKLLALFGPQVTEAVSVADENAAGWRSVDREIYFDLLTQEWMVRLAIKTYGGESYPLKETPNSVLILSRGLLDTVLTAVEAAGPSLVDPEHVRATRELATEFLEHMKEGEEAAG